jgi:hypothetical protein
VAAEAPLRGCSESFGVTPSERQTHDIGEAALARKCRARMELVGFVLVTDGDDQVVAPSLGFIFESLANKRCQQFEIDALSGLMGLPCFHSPAMLRS